MTNSINIVYATNDNYCKFTWLSIASLIQMCSANYHYCINILYTDISKQNIATLKSLQKENVSINFINVYPIISRYKKEIFSLNSHFSIETYYRFFLAEIFQTDDKCLYIDSDTIIQSDISKLYQIPLEDYYLAATKDLSFAFNYNYGIKEVVEYANRYLSKLDNLQNYFQAGILLINLEEFRKNNLIDKFINILLEIKNPMYVDQDILNIVCQHKVKFLEQNWNYTWHVDIEHAILIDKYLSANQYQDFLKARNNSFIIHYTGKELKPTDIPTHPLAKIFWYYASQSPYFEELFNKAISNKLNNRLDDTSPNKIRTALLQKKIKKYSLLKSVCFGKLKEEYSKRYEAYLQEYNYLKKYK